MEYNKITKWASFYNSLGWSVFPCRVYRPQGEKKWRKTPLIDWKIYQTQKADDSQIIQWFEKDFTGDDVFIGVATGKISGIFIFDIDTGGTVPDNLPETPQSQTPSGGKHFILKYPENKIIKNSSKQIGAEWDIRGEGGYFVAPSRDWGYSWIVSPHQIAPSNAPAFLLDLIEKFRKEKKDWVEFIHTDILDGERNVELTSLTGKLFSAMPQSTWFLIPKIVLEQNRSYCKPPIPEKEVMTIIQSIQGYHQKETGRGVESKSKSQSNLILEIVEKNENIILFHDEMKEPYVCLIINGHQEIWRCRSKQFKRWLAKSFWGQYQKSANSDASNTALTVIEGKACFDGKKFELANRVAWQGDALWYDLSDANWRAVEITKQGWKIVDMPPILFRRYAHQQAQVFPDAAGGDASLILKFVNIQNDEQKLLFLTYVISCFIPDFPHPIPNIYGSQGSAKSTLSKVVRLLVDPSAIEVSEFPRTAVELIQKLSHHWCIFFDNVSYLPYFVSDTLCRVVTGSGFSKRELYSDDEDVIYTFKRCVGLNGINLVADKPDLLERSILFELDRVPKDQRRQEKELFEEFERERPKILGGIFDALVRALQIKDSIHLASLPRMADFAVWGCAIAEALGHTHAEFLNAYDENIQGQNKEVLYENFEASALMAFMGDKTKWKGTPSELLTELEGVATNALGVNVRKEKSFPKAANVLSRRLNQLKSNLAEAGINIERREENQRRIIYIQKVSNNIVSTYEPSSGPSQSNDIENDKQEQSSREPSPMYGRTDASRYGLDDKHDSIQAPLDFTWKQ